MPETDNQPESVAVRYAVFASAVFLIGGGLLAALGTGIVGRLILLAGAVLALLTGVLFVALKFLAVPSANALLGFLGYQSGSGTPPLKGYSAIEALAARGRYQEAAKAYRGEIAADPSDVEARSRLAQLLLNHLDDPMAAAQVLAEARDRAKDERHRVGYALRLVDLYRSRLRNRGKAMVELRRFIDTHPQSPHLDGVRRELSELIEEMRSEQNSDTQ
jgi:tetratricopeptide (TPR) repeat protein